MSGVNCWDWLVILLIFRCCVLCWICVNCLRLCCVVLFVLWLMCRLIRMFFLNRLWMCFR